MLINFVRFLLLAFLLIFSFVVTTTPSCSAAATKKPSRQAIQKKTIKKQTAKIAKVDSSKGSYSKQSTKTKSTSKSGYRTISTKKSTATSKGTYSKISSKSKGKSAKKTTAKKAINRKVTYNKNYPQPKAGRNLDQVSPVARVTVNEERGKYGLDRVNLNYDNSSAILGSIPTFETEFAGRTAAINQKNDFVFFPTKSTLQKLATELARRANADNVGIVVMNPKTGEILALAGKSDSLPNPVFHSLYPAASLFKLVTATAGVELGKIASNSFIPFRGSDYTLDRWNYSPNNGRDNRRMSVEEALGKSCNPVFGRIALNYLNTASLQTFANRFGFNDSIFSDYDLAPSQAYIPADDDYDLSRAAAGFGQVTISPIHAAAIISSIANGGILIKPRLIDRVVDSSGVIQYKSQLTSIRRVMSPKTASEMLEMMEATTLRGTTRREFARGGARVFPWRVAAKTGTLNGTNPRGLNQWFIATAPIENPQIAVAIVTVNKRNSSSSPAHIGKLLLQEALE